MTTYQSLQEQVIEYFKDTDDKTFIALVETFVYCSPVGDNKKVSELIEKFLKDNCLSEAYVNYLMDLKDEDSKDHPKRFFNRSSLSQRDIIEKIKASMLNASFNRFRKVMKKRDTNKTVGDELKKIKKSVKKLLDPGTPDGFDEAIDELRYIAFE